MVKKSTPSPTDDKKALRLAETTDLSPNQAKALLEKHGGDARKAAREAENFKAES